MPMVITKLLAAISQDLSSGTGGVDLEELEQRLEFFLFLFYFFYFFLFFLFLASSLFFCDVIIYNLTIHLNDIIV